MPRTTFVRISKMFPATIGITLFCCLLAFFNFQVLRCRLYWGFPSWGLVNTSWYTWRCRQCLIRIHHPDISNISHFIIQAVDREKGKGKKGKKGKKSGKKSGKKKKKKKSGKKSGKKGKKGKKEKDLTPDR